MKSLNEVWSAIGNSMRSSAAPREPQPRGFHPALLDFATMSIHRLPLASGFPMPRTTIAGYERGGFFYTRSAAVRACKEWGLGR